ncbi:hypothetical protein O6P43_017301 [Quillaja saponaria]|uniref:Uncharacterized protein n=1 Tax=Quillaja saponaria TaxID=32244 RepID=A0AAD7LPL4_QUISA|nr:hypothetical protein O6P43_017301 [Quillaja saponaria]
MVFNSVSQTEAPSLPEAKPPMASSAFSANSQSLDNFTPVELNWSINQSNNLLFRTLPDPTHLPPTHYPEFPPFSPLLNDHIRSHQSEFLPVSPLNDQLRPHQSEAPPFYFVKNDHLHSHQSDVPPVSLVKNDQLQSRRLGDSVQSSELCYASSSPSESQVIKLGASLRFLFSDAFESNDRNGTLCEGKNSDLVPFGEATEEKGGCY